MEEDIHVEKKGEDYLINGKIVHDVLEFSREERDALRSFKIDQEKGLEIKSTIRKK